MAGGQEDANSTETLQSMASFLGRGADDVA